MHVAEFDRRARRRRRGLARRLDAQVSGDTPSAMRSASVTGKRKRPMLTASTAGESGGQLRAVHLTK